MINQDDNEYYLRGYAAGIEIGICRAEKDNAERIGVMQDHIETIENEAFRLKDVVNDLQNQLAGQDSLNEELREKLAESNRLSHQYRNETNRLAAIIEAREITIGKLELELEESRQQAKRIYDYHSGRADRLWQEAHQLHNQVADLEDAVEARDTKIHDLEQELGTEKFALHELRESYSKQQSELNLFQCSVDNLQALLNRAKMNLDLESSSRKYWEGKARELEAHPPVFMASYSDAWDQEQAQAKLSRQGFEIEELGARLREQVQTNNIQNSSLTQARFERDKALKQIEALEANASARDQAILSAAFKAAQYKQQAEEAQAEIEDLVEKNRSHKDLIDNLTRYNDKLNTDSAALRVALNTKMWPAPWAVTVSEISVSEQRNNPTTEVIYNPSRCEYKIRPVVKPSVERPNPATWARAFGSTSDAINEQILDKAKENRERGFWEAFKVDRPSNTQVEPCPCGNPKCPLSTPRKGLVDEMTL